jgi:hypothetical protein
MCCGEVGDIPLRKTEKCFPQQEPRKKRQEVPRTTAEEDVESQRDGYGYFQMEKKWPGEQLGLPKEHKSTISHYFTTY